MFGRRKKEKEKKGALLVVSGFSGVGKGTVIAKLMKDHPEYSFSVSATTRSPRPGELDGREYFFIDRETFDQYVKEDRFLEHTEYLDRCYGTLRSYVEDQRNQSHSIILDIEVEGALNVKRACPDAKLIYIIPPSAEELMKRLTGRGTESQEQIRGRVMRAVEETDVIPQYDYVVVNDEVDTTAEEIHRLAQSKGSLRRSREETLALAEQIRADLREILKSL